MARINLKNISASTLMSMSDDEILALAKRGLDKNKMTEKAYAKAHRSNLAEITSRLTSVANRRIKALGKTKIGRVSPAYVRAREMSKSGLFSVKGKKWNALRNTISEVKQFLNYETSTLKGWENVRTRIEADIGGELNTEYKSRKFWEVYRRVYEKHGFEIARKGSSSRLTSDRVQQALYNTITSKKTIDDKRIDWRTSVDKLTRLADEDLNELYVIDKKSRKDIGASRYDEDEEDEE